MYRCACKMQSLLCNLLTDEELARQLQEQEEKQQGTPAVPNLQEIMDMEMALALYRSDQVL